METIEYKGYKIEIEQDFFGDNPRNWDNLGTIVYKTKDYDLGDKEIPEYWLDEEGNEQYIDTVEDITKWITQEYGEIAVILPIYMYEHSGIVLKTSSFNDKFDSGQIGYIFVTKERLQKEELDEKQAEEILRDEVSTLSQFVSGDVWTSYVFEPKKCDKCGHTEWEEVDGNGDIYGYEEALSLAYNTIDRLAPLVTENVTA